MMAFAGALILSLGSCADECDDVTCDNGGTCDEGDCTCTTNYYGETCADFCENGTYNEGDCMCDDGYEGGSCSTESREKFIGSWTYTTSCDPGNSSNSEITTVSDNVQRVTITNLTGFNDNTAYAVISGSMIEIPSQSVTDSDGDTWTVSSNSATMANNTFTINVTYSIGGSTIT